MLPYTAGWNHPLSITVARLRWPPFYSAPWLLPRLRITLTNDARLVRQDVSMQLDIREYEGPIGDLPSATGRWVEAVRRELPGPWDPGQVRAFTERIPARVLPTEGTYVVRLSLTKWVERTGTLAEELLRALEQSSLGAEERAAVLLQVEGGLMHGGEDLAAPAHGQRAEPLGRAFVFEYIRVEPFSNVITFGLALAILLIALGTLLLAIRA